MRSAISYPLTASLGLAFGLAFAVYSPPSVQQVMTVQYQSLVGQLEESVAVEATGDGSEEAAEVKDLASIGRCDEAASHPDDPNRFARGVADKDVALGLAVQECYSAVAAAPSEPRMHFQLGRVLWLSGRHDEAVLALAEAADIGYPPAEKIIGDAYLEGKGLPPGDVQDIYTALSWYKSAAEKGYIPAEQAIQEVNEYIKKNTFDSSIYQNPQIATAIYNGDFDDMGDPLAFFAYANGMFEMLDSEQAMDHAPECKPLLNKLGQIKIVLGQLSAYIANPVGGLIDIFTGGLISMIPKDQGSRDAVSLINVHGCDSEVAIQMVGNLGKMEGAIRSHIQKAQQRK